MKAMPYQITVAWSPEDEAYVARVPALRYCVATGETPEKAVKEVRAAAVEILRVMKEDGKTLPALDTTLARVQELQPLINVSAIAKAAGLSVQTLSSKITRGTALTSDESTRIGKVFISYGLEDRGTVAAASSAIKAANPSKAATKSVAGRILAPRGGIGSMRSLAASALSRPDAKAAKKR
jgi:predicted RNase H-like HicB family nuclease